MRLGIIIGILAVVAGLVVFVLVKEPAEKEPGLEKSEPEQMLANPWIEVSRNRTLELEKETEAEKRELKTGDELEAQAVVKTDQTGFANIYLSDGSAIRLDALTKFILEEQTFDPKTEKLTAKIILSAGRLWSKIFELTTPDSLWQVKTSNAVATVRGTAFGIEYLNGKTSILGSENQIVVSALDPETGKIIEQSQAVVPAGKFLEIKDEEIKAIKKEPALVAKAVKTAPKQILEQDWVKRAKKADLELEQKIEELKQKGLERKDWGQELREEFGQVSEMQVSEMTPPTTPAVQPIQPEPTAETQPEPATEPAPEIQPEIQPEPTLEPQPQPQSLILETQSDLSHIIEEQVITFKAILIMDNGEKKDVTDLVQWQVLGLIGRIEEPGVFAPKIDISVAELGEGFGTVIATWVDEETGAAFLAESPILNVKLKIEEVIDRRG